MESNLAGVMAALKRTSALLPLPGIDNLKQQLWQNRVASGEPALAEGDFPVQDAALLVLELIKKVEKKPVVLSQAVQWVEQYMAEQSEAGCCQDCDISPTRGVMYIHLACQMALAHSAKMVKDAISIEGWNHNSCPICGAAPAFASMETVEGRRMLVCGACLTHWRYKRIGCSFCGEENPDQLKVLATDEFPGWSTAVCLSCHGYLKIADMRQLATEPIWQNAMIELLPLDYAAEKWVSAGVPSA